METHDHDCNDNYHLADIYHNHDKRRDCCSDASRATGQTPRCERRPRRPTVAPYAGGSSRQNVPTTTTTITAEVGARHRDALNTRMFRSLWHCTLMCLSVFIAFSNWNGNAQPRVFATATPSLSSFVINNPLKATSISFVSSSLTPTRQFHNDPYPPNCQSCHQTRPTTTNIHEYYHRYFTCHRWRRKCITVLQMGKGDGKKKRKKKSTTSASSASTPQPPSPSPTPPPPPRVTTSINIPIRRQIRFANLKKEYLKSASTSFRASNIKKRTAYRKTLDEEEVEAAKLERQKRGREPDWDVILNATAATPLVLVDGYNVIHQWSRLKKWMVKAGQTSESGIGIGTGTGIGTANLQRARDLLVRDLEELHNIKGWRIECVFDGFGRSVVGPLGSGPGDKISSSDRVATATDTGRGVRIVYSGVGASADSYIESRCLDAKAITEGKTTGQLIVVSNDSMIRMVGTGAGALCMSSDRLVDELKAVKKASAYRVEAALAIANGVGYVRPEGLRNGMSEGARKMQSIHAFKAGGQFVIEDKRNKRKKKRNGKPSDGNGADDGDDDRTVDDGCRDGDEENKPKRKAVFEDLVEGTQTLPSWAIVPKNATDFRHRLR